MFFLPSSFVSLEVPKQICNRLYKCSDFHHRHRRHRCPHHVYCHYIVITVPPVLNKCFLSDGDDNEKKNFVKVATVNNNYYNNNDNKKEFFFPCFNHQTFLGEEGGETGE